MATEPSPPGRLRVDAPFDRIRDDGLEMRLRPLAPGDREGIHRADALLSEESRLNRFWERPVGLSAHHAERLSDVDGSDHLSWIAVSPEDEAFPGFGGASHRRAPIIRRAPSCPSPSPTPGSGAVSRPCFSPSSGLTAGDHESATLMEPAGSRIWRWRSGGREWEEPSSLLTGTTASLLSLPHLIHSTARSPTVSRLSSARLKSPNRCGNGSI